MTLNAAVTYLEPSDSNRRLMSVLAAGTVEMDDRLRDGLVVVHYRARPKTNPLYAITKSYVGLALFNADMELVYRFPEPVVSPGTDPADVDFLGAEDPRVTRVGDEFHMAYCGSGLDINGRWAGTLCHAKSKDLLHWKKHGPIPLSVPQPAKRIPFDNTYFDNIEGASGTSTVINNKDGVFLPDQIDGRYFFLHRPMIGRISTWSIHLAVSKSMDGEWHDCGSICRATPDPAWQDSWIGAGAVPLPLGDNRYLTIVHTGHRDAKHNRFYTLNALVLDLSDFEPAHPERVVVSRLDRIMIPETRWEIEGPSPDSVGNVLFSCGAFEREGDIYVIYGGGDTYVMAARINKADLLAAMVQVN